MTIQSFDRTASIKVQTLTYECRQCLTLSRLYISFIRAIKPHGLCFYRRFLLLRYSFCPLLDSKLPVIDWLYGFGSIFLLSHQLSLITYMIAELVQDLSCFFCPWGPKRRNFVVKIGCLKCLRINLPRSSSTFKTVLYGLWLPLFLSLIFSLQMLLIT